MVDKEILGGLRSAISRGDSLQKAMFSLFNAGYEKEKIEEAARIVQKHYKRKPSKEPIKKPKTKPLKKKRKPKKYKKVSDYGKKKKPKKKGIEKIMKTLTILIIIFAVLLVLSLAFKQEIAEIIKNILSQKSY